MSDCKKAHDLFSLALEHEASQYEQTFVDGHLSACADCRREWLDFKESQSMLAALPRLVVSASFEDRVMAAMREAVREQRPVPEWRPVVDAEPSWWQAWLPRFGLAGAAAALVALVTFPALRPGTSGLGAGGAGTAPVSTAQAQPVVDRLEDRFPDLPPEVLRSLDEESYVLDRMTVRPAVSGGQRVVAPVSDEAGGSVFITF
jgi:anti-sigma factor RsiW